MCNDAPSCCLFRKSAFQQHCLRQSINFLVKEILFAGEIAAVSFNIFPSFFFSYNLRIFSSEIISRPVISQTIPHNCSALHRRKSSIIYERAAPQQGGLLHMTVLRTAVPSFYFIFEFLPHPFLDTCWSLSIGPVYNYLSIGFLPFCLLSSQEAFLGLKGTKPFPVFHLTKLPSPTQKVRD